MKPTLLLLHGALGSSRQFSTFEKLLEANFELLKLDFRGHGENELSTQQLSIELFVKDVWGFLAERKIEKTHIFGYSMGGFVALQLALAHPEKVDTIVTLATKFNWNKESAAAEVKFLNPEKIKEKVPAFAKHLRLLHGTKWEILMQKTAEIMLQLGDKNSLSLAELAKIKKRIQLSLGEHDKMVTLQETQGAHEVLKNSTLHIFENTPHPWEQVNQSIVALELIRFFKGV